jgi:hypothetical protein
MTRKLSPKDTAKCEGSASEAKPKVLGFRVSEKTYWLARRQAAAQQMDVAELLASIVLPALKEAA